MGNLRANKQDYELKSKENIFELTILEKAKSMFYYLNAETGNMEYISPASECVIGYTPEEVKSMGISQLDLRFHPDDEPTRSQVAQHLSNKTIPPENLHHTEHRFKHKNGNYIWLCFHRSFITDGDGQLAAMVGCVSDITKDKEQQQSLLNALQKSIESYKRLCDASFEGIVIHKQGNHVECNQQFANMFGYTIEEIYAMPGRKLVHPDYWQLVNKFIINKESSYYQSLCVRKDGTTFPVEVRGKQIQIAGEDYRLAVFRDLTTQKKMEDELLETHRKYQQLYDNSQAGLFRTSISSGRALECNERIVKILGYSSKEELIANYRPEVYYADKNLREKFIQEISQKNTVNGFEVELYRKDGSICWLKVSAKIFPEQGYIDCAAFDITALKVLSDIEKQVLSQILEGYASREIAVTLNKSTRTVEDQRAQIMKKLNATNLVELAIKALEMGFEQM